MVELGFEPTLGGTKNLDGNVVDTIEHSLDVAQSVRAQELTSKLQNMAYLAQKSAWF